MKIIYSFNKKGFEADYWTREIAAASRPDCEFIPFNHGTYLDPNLYLRAQLLDNLYYQEDAPLMHMYEEIRGRIAELGADALIVDNFPPYHPDFLRKLKLYKVLRISDGPICAYDRDFVYVHAYDHILYNSPAYSRDMGMSEKLSYVGAKRSDLWKLALFDRLFDTTRTEETILSHERDIDVLFVGSLHVGKMKLLAKVKNALGKSCRMHGVASMKKNIYFNLRYGFPGWLAPIDFEEYVPLYQRTKIGFNVHNRGLYTVGNYRLFDLPGNGVMQISDGGPYLESFFKVGDEIVGYDSTDDLIDNIRYFLKHDHERNRIALNGFKRVMSEHRISNRLQEAAKLIATGINS